MSVWLSVSSVYGYAADLLWDDDEEGEGLPDDVLNERVLAWTQRLDERLREKSSQSLVWVTDPGIQPFNEQTSWSMLLATQVAAGCLDHPELARPTSLDAIGDHPAADERYLQRFDQLTNQCWVPLDFAGHIEMPMMASEDEVVRVGSSFALRRQLQTLHQALHGGTEADMISWLPRKDERADSYDYQLRFGLSLLAAAARHSTESNLLIFCG